MQKPQRFARFAGSKGKERREAAELPGRGREGGEVGVAGRRPGGVRGRNVKVGALVVVVSRTR